MAGFGVPDAFSDSIIKFAGVAFFGNESDTFGNGTGLFDASRTLKSLETIDR